MKYTAPYKALYFLLLSGTGLIGACSQEPARSVDEFIENPRLLEATMVRCAAKRLELKYTDECVNAREAVDRLAAREDESTRDDLEAESMRKRDALRRAHQASEEARARAEEAERLRREAEYLGQFDELPVSDAEMPADGATVLPGTAPEMPAVAEGETPPTDPDAGTTLDEVREELRRRQQAPQD